MDNIEHIIDEIIEKLSVPQHTIWPPNKVLSLFAYAGGKMTTLYDILANSPKPPLVDTIVAPFGGSGCELINQRWVMKSLGFEPFPIVIYGDVDNRLRYFWQAVREQPRELLRLLSSTEYSYEQYKSSFDVDYNDSGIPLTEKARAYFVHVNQAIGRMASNAGWYNNSSGNSKDRIREINNHLCYFNLVASEVSKWTIDNRLTDYKHALKTYDREHVYLYLDPPYLLPVDNRARANATGMYKHEFSREEYFEFASLVSEVKNAAVTVMGHNNPEMNDLFPAALGWHRISIKISKPLIGKAVDNGGLLKETCMWLNRRGKELANLSLVNRDLFE